MHHQMALNISYIENFSLRIYLQNWLRYGYSKCQFLLLCSAINFLARDTKLRTIRVQDISYVSWKFQRSRPSSCWDTALWSWLAGVVCSAQRGLLTHWTCVLTRLHKNLSHGQTKLQSNSLPGCFKMFLVSLGTFSNWFDSRKTLPFFGFG